MSTGGFPWERAYLILGLVICMGTTYANSTGWVVMDSMRPSRWVPAGQNVYHK